MPEFLVFRLYGPMASWGGMTFGEVRPSETRPSRSAVFGLIAAALGIRRDDMDTLRRLQGGYQMATLVHAPGTLLRDYHTTQVPPNSVKKRQWPFATRKEEMSVPREDLETILSTREYLCDALHTVCLWPAMDRPLYLLADIAEALRAPSFIPYLGRKSCPLALPLHPQVVSALDLHAALAAAAFPDRGLLYGLARPDTGMLFWEGSATTGFEIRSRQTVPRRDVALNRRQWTFSKRQEHGAMVTIPEGLQ